MLGQIYPCLAKFSQNTVNPGPSLARNIYKLKLRIVFGNMMAG